MRPLPRLTNSLSPSVDGRWYRLNTAGARCARKTPYHTSLYYCVEVRAMARLGCVPERPAGYASPPPCYGSMLLCPPLYVVMRRQGVQVITTQTILSTRSLTRGMIAKRRAKVDTPTKRRVPPVGSLTLRLNAAIEYSVSHDGLMIHIIGTQR